MRLNTFLLLLLAAAPVKAVQSSTTTQPDRLAYTVSALAEMVLPMQLHACQTAYPEMHDSAEALFASLPFDARQDPEKQQLIAEVRRCFALTPPLTRPQCQKIIDNMSRLSRATTWSSTERQLGLDYLRLSRQTQTTLAQTVDHCLGQSSGK